VSTIYHDQDADLETLAGKTLAVIGYGNQGRSQALNLRDSGLRVVVGNVGDESLARARDEGFEATPIAEACARADAILLLVPDEVMPGVYERDVAPSLRSGDLLDFASGYNIAFGLIRPPADVDVVMVAPRMIGPGVRDTYIDGRGFPSFVGVHQDASGEARQRMLALAKGLGSTRAGCIEMSFRDEACLDLFTEQGFGPAFGRVLTTAVETLVDAGFPPEAVLLELYLSGELAYTFEKIREVGLLRQMDFHSRTSQYGSITRSARFAHLAEPLRERMQEVLEDIRSGRFAEEWSGQQATAQETFAKIREVREQTPFAAWERTAREAFGIGDATGRQRP
jgi:ketol-acid reductoisomerase